MAQSMDVVLFSTADWDAPYWTNKQHTAHHLAALGFRVLYIESPGLRSPTANRKDVARLMRRMNRSLHKEQMVESRIWVLPTIGIPLKHHWPLIRTVNQKWMRRRLIRFLERHQFCRPVIWTYHPFILDALHGLDYSKLVYHSVDDLAAIPGVDSIPFREEEKRLVARADIIFTTSELLREKYLLLNANTHYMPNVTDPHHFGRALEPGNLPEDIAAIPEPRIGYVGVLSDFKVDFALILAVVRQRPDWNWVFIGQERESQENQVIAELRDQENVHFLGYKPYAVLPDYLRGLSVGTLPALINQYTRCMFPMKYFDYLAAGLRVVATPLEFTRYHTAGLEVAAEPTAYLAAIDRQLERGRLAAEEAIAFVGDNTWKDRLEKMLDYLGMRP